MAVELEQTVMNEIGLGNNYRYFNGSGSCRYIRNNAIDLLPKAMKKHKLSLSKKWAEVLRKASMADEIDGHEYALTNVWVTASYAIQDGIYRKEGGKGINATDDHFSFFDSEAKENYFSTQQVVPGGANAPMGEWLNENKMGH